MFKSILLMVVGAGLFAVSVRADEARPASNPDRVVAAVPTVAHPAPTPTPAGIDVGWMFPLPAQASIDAPDAETHSVAVAANLYVVWYKMPGKRWTGISGLSYYHACQLCDRYQKRGWSSYVEQQQQRR